jgi:triacylglycerol esterase/lipase EstA (alpha/beta hydrolase family)
MTETTHEPEPDLIYCVHGTFASESMTATTPGTRWWQRASNTWDRLDSTYPRAPSCPTAASHCSTGPAETPWPTGLDASHQLLARLLEFESHGRPYQLIGHSHGGSVTWEALVAAHLMRE